MPRPRPNIFNLKSKKVIDIDVPNSTRAVKAIKDVVDKFNKVYGSVEPTLKALYRDSQRAKGTRERLQDGRAVLIKSLRILQENDDADARVDAATSELAEVEAQHANLNNRFSNGLVLFSKKKVENEEKYQRRKRSELGRVIKEFKRVRDNFRRATKDNFGTQLIRKSDEEQTDQKLIALFKDVYHILDTKGNSKSKHRLVPNLLKALCIWQEAYEAQVDIASIYSDTRIYNLKFEAENLLYDVRSEELRDHPNVYQLRFWTNEMKSIKKEVREVQLSREESRKIRETNRRLRKAMNEMAALRQKATSEAGDTEQNKYYRDRQGVGFRRMFTRHQPQIDRDSTSASSNASTAGSQSRESSRVRTPYPNF